MVPHNKNLNKIITYEPGKSGRRGSKRKIIKLSSNESPLPLSANTINKIKNININLAKYPDPQCTKLREVLAKKYKLKPNNIIFGNGSDELFYLISYCYLNDKFEGLYSKHGFLIYPIAINAASAKSVFASEKNYKADVNQLLKKSNKKTRVCFIANPNNPTGTYLNKKEIIKLREGLPKQCLLVIDSAYSEYVVEKDYSDGLAYAKKRNDIVVTRTFSKIYGMSSLRLGWAYCPENIAKILEKIRPAFNINSYAQEIAINILRDDKFIKKSIEHNLYWKKWLANELKKLGIEVVSGVANFILVILNKSSNASFLADELEKNDVYVRTLNNYKLNNCLRISIGSGKDLNKLVNLIKRIYKERKNDFI
ncbi:MAG: histidinol-phosphate transaminase [Rickettsiales bacterium]|nr:histidinol-phosphate transaminase [Rickettsiales bacterium]OUV78965.1 MAG: histidinol-phosphate transaminase [Rickettsiales bacterium TMED131]